MYLLYTVVILAVLGKATAGELAGVASIKNCGVQFGVKTAAGSLTISQPSLITIDPSTCLYDQPAGFTVVASKVFPSVTAPPAVVCLSPSKVMVSADTLATVTVYAYCGLTDRKLANERKLSKDVNENE